jgi:HEAT repeat protein
VVDLRARVAELTASRETLLSRIAEWQCAVRDGNTEAVDLAEFIAVLSRDILELEHRSVVAERGEAELREELLRASAQGYVSSIAAHPPAAETPPQAVDPTNGPAGSEEAAAPTAGDEAVPRIDARLGRSGEADAFDAIQPSLVAPDPGVRAAAYQALGHLLEHDPSRLEPHVRRGIADADPRVRRRVVLVAAAARGLKLARLLEPLKRDPNPQVRRVVQEVLRRTPSAADGAGETSSPVSEQIRSGAAS